jgi:two-component system, sensor histidine kinase and response regulator
MNNGSKHILLIEDNQGDADLVRLRLVEAQSDVNVNCVDRLSLGLESLAENPPSVVLLDLNLPDSRGAETFRSILRKAPGVPVLVLSGQDDEELAVKAVHQGVQDYLVKGNFDSKQLVRAIRYAVERQALLTSLDMSRKQQLQFKNEFLSHVSHELRTPLTCIHQFVTILLDGLAGGILPEQQEHLGTILRSANQLQTMIADLLEATRAESGKLRIEPRCIAIGDVIHQAAAMLQATAQEKGVGLEMSVDAGIPLVLADPERIIQVLTNLIDNAIKFTPSSGLVTVKAGLVDHDPEFLYVSVTDTGRGISPESRALIFERLYQDPNAIDNSRKGLGLGLYIVQELVRLNGGRIWVESQLAHGSIFSFTLPLFSLEKLLTPTITVDGRLRDSLVLVTVERMPLMKNGVGNWPETRQRCLEIIQGCIFIDKDFVLPALGNTGPNETFVIVASTDEKHAVILRKRIQGQLDSCPELQSNSVFKISVLPVDLPSRDGKEPVMKLVEKVADSITGMVMTIFRRHNSEG